MLGKGLKTMLPDLEIAKSLLERKDLSLVVIRDGEVVKESKGKGILPLFELVEQEISLKGAVLADKIIGRAAAFLILNSKLKAIYARVISKGGLKLLEDKIDCYYRYETDNILGNDGKGMCPVETSLLDIDEDILAYKKIKMFLQKK